MNKPGWFNFLHFGRYNRKPGLL